MGRATGKEAGSRTYQLSTFQSILKSAIRRDGRIPEEYTTKSTLISKKY